MAFTDLDDPGLVRTLAQKQRDLVSARFSLSMNRLENTASIKAIRKDIARLQTEMRRREKSEGLPKDELARRHRVDLAELSSADSGAAAGGFLSSVVDKLDE